MQKLKVSVIGAGWYAAENHIPVLQRRDDVILDGVCRLGTADLARVKQHFGFAFASEHHQEVLARAPDAVIVASPHALHYTHTRDALEAGAHVLCEKPFTLDPAHAWDLVDRAQRLNRHLLIANGHNYLPHFATLASRLQDGLIGDIEQVSCQFSSATRPVFSGGTGFERWNRTFFRPARTTWQDPEAGGGFAYGQMSHSVALLLWLTGLRATAVNARRFAENGIDLHDTATVAFDNGAIGAVFGGASVPEGGRARLRLSLAGTKGILDIDVDLDRCELHLNDGSIERFDVRPDEWIYDCVGPVNALIDLAQGHGSNLSSGETGARTTELIHALVRSSQQAGQTVVIEQSPASTD